VYAGSVAYLPTYISDNPRVPYGIISGKVTMTRLAGAPLPLALDGSDDVTLAEPATKFSISLWVERFSKFGSVPSSAFYGYLHNLPCEFGGGEKFQDPYVCDAEARCDSTTVNNAADGPAPLEYKLDTTAVRPDGATMISSTDVWPVHIPTTIASCKWQSNDLCVRWTPSFVPLPRWRRFVHRCQSSRPFFVVKFPKRAARC
jgi:hypothetical protein